MTRSSPSPRVVKFHAPEMIIGEGALAEAALAASRLGMRRPLLVSDARVAATAWFDELITRIAAVGLHAKHFTGVSPNPRAGEITAAFETYTHAGCDGIIALGGGSVIDAAKGVAIIASNGGHILEYEGIDRASKPLPPVVAIPTTAGSGSDVSQFCIVNDPARATKITIIGRGLVPDVTVVDPRVLATVPSDVTAQCGMDVLTHCIEAYVSIARSRMTDNLALQSISTTWRNLERLVDEPSDPQASVAMAYASLEAGMAFTNAILGAAHAMSHPVGGRCDAPHGAINSVLLPHVIRYNAHVCADGFVDLAGAIGIATDGSPMTVADRLADEVAKFAARIGMPSSLTPLGVQKSDVTTLSVHALADSCMTTNPRQPDQDTVAGLYLDAL
ncbi:iron-containing alcohol dehydrogenase [Nocardia sp. 348MFTsu5.1]|uniref:iron-containing alcohol dehydrogenase n=1 Tax=Nocardia sp. 348MFTsu5.1 TaxID=1172185 RepID=UPI0003A2784D|nr:iron-containing alcohol dehydrogenase [Nocardia sp. 348MFTsu5.1]